jgi:Tol biopolymer transport system component/DNA-binding winged helix-turn-helix (wHTH) protein
LVQGENQVATGLNGNLAGVVRFGVYEVDPQAGELRRNGVKIKLQEQPFQLLTILLERPGEVISREEMQRRLWPVDTFVDFDHSLNAAVKRLRDALRDSADNPRFVETLSRRGYRFVAPVAGTAKGAAKAPNVGPDIPDAKVAPHPGYVPGRVARWVVGIFLLVGACISVGWRIGHGMAQPVAPREVRLTANSPDVPVYRASISPDGRLLAYTDPRGAFLREISREDSHPLWSPPNFKAHSASWFPDGSHILLGGVADEGGKSSLWNVSILGGTPRKVTEETDSGTVSPDATKIAFLKGDDKFNSSELWVMNVDGSEIRKLQDIAGFSNSLAWSPTGKRLAYLKATYWPGNSEQVEIESYEFATGKSKQLYSDNRLQGGLSWNRDGRLFFTRGEENSNSESNVWSVRVDEQNGDSRGQLTRHTSGPDWKPRPEVSADGKHLTFLRSNIAPTVYVADIDPKTKALEKLQRLTLDESRSRPYEWTPDGKAVLYVSDRDGEFHIFRQNIGASSPDLLVDGHDSPGILRLNPDATEILYTSVRPLQGSPSAPPAPHTPAFEGQKVRLMHAPVSGGAGQLLLDADGINNFQCARAPSHMCLFSRFEKDALAFVQFDAATGAMKEIFRTTDTGWQDYNWTLSPDGKLLALCREARVSQDATIRLISLSDRTERMIRINEWAGIVAFDWAADGKSFWASAILKGEARGLVNIDLHGNLKTVVNADKPFVGWAIPSRDGKHLAMWQSTGGSNVWMLDGF